MSSVILSVSPTLFLKGLVSTDIYNKYNAGEYRYFTLDYIKNIKINLNGKLSNISAIGKDSYSDIFTKSSFKNQIQIYCTDNCHYFNTFSQGVTGETKCYWCRKTFNGQPVGYPIRMDIETGGEDSPDYYIFHSTTAMCTFQCALAGLHQDLKLGKAKPESLVYLKFAYEKIYPKAGPLCPAPDWELLKSNGGSLDDNEYYLNTHRYIKTSSVVFSPVKTIYEKLKNGNY